MKTSIITEGDDEAIRYPLKRKNYLDLILPDVLAPRVLVLVILPREIERWLSVSPNDLVLRNSAYWVSLAGLPPTDNEISVTVSVPRANIFTPEALCGMMQNINELGSLE